MRLDPDREIRGGVARARTADPILKPLETIECRDAVVTPEGKEPTWPEANVVIGNPPFFGHRMMLKILGEEYTRVLRQTYRGSVPAFADLVCYWFHKAGTLVSEGKLECAGLAHLYHAPPQFLATSYGYDIQNRQVALQLRAQG